MCYCVYEHKVILTHMLGLLRAAISLSTNSSTASIEDEVGSKPYNEDVIQK